MAGKYPNGPCAEMPVDDSGKRLDRYIKRHKVSRYKLASLTGLSEKTVGDICKGKRSGNMATWRCICRALRCTLDDIMEG